MNKPYIVKQYIETMTAMSKPQDSGQDKGVIKQVGDFLFGKPQSGSLEDGEFLDMRTDVNTKQMYTALLYYRVLGASFQCKAATLIANILERLAVSTDREGRKEGVMALLQKIQSPKYLPTGFDELAAKYASGEFGDNRES